MSRARRTLMPRPVASGMPHCIHAICRPDVAKIRHVVKRYCLVLVAACGSSPGPAAALDGAADTPGLADATPDAAACGLRTGLRGKTSRMLHVANLARTYIVYLPTAVDPTTPIPLVYVHHGYTMSGDAMFSATGYPALADSEHIALVFPDGQSGPNS